MKPLGKVKLEWSAAFAYAIGLLVADGYLSSNQRHITIVSKDREMLENFKKCLGIKNLISNHISGAGNVNLRVQFGDVRFYDFLNSIGMTNHKSKTIRALQIPDEYLFDFLRGSFDGDRVICFIRFSPLLAKSMSFGCKSVFLQH